MIDIKEVKKHLDECHSYRINKNSRSMTVFKSKDTPDVYYWYVIHDIPIKIKDKPIKIYESEIFTDITLMIGASKLNKDFF